MQLIEIHEQKWFPQALRDYLTDALQMVENAGRFYAPIVPRLTMALQKAKTQQVLDLCSGGAGPWLGLYRVFDRQRDMQVAVCLTDKFPNAAAFEQARIASSNRIASHAAPVDATRIPADLIGFRTLFTSFHHFQRADARKILRDAVEKQQGVGVFEIARRNFFTMILVTFVPVMIWIWTPMIRPFRWSRLFWIYVIPVIPFVAWFDGVVSCLRAYSPAELRQLTEEFSSNGYQWDVGEEKAGFLPVPVTYLIGYPFLAQDSAVGT